MLAIPRKIIHTYPFQLFDIVKHLLSGTFLLGKETAKFEQEFTDYIEVKHSIAVASGRTGLALILKALELDQGDEVLLSAYNEQSVPNTIQELGLKPVFVDIQKHTDNIDPTLIDTKVTPKTKAIIVTHLLGRACDLDRILAISKQHSLFLIEDCAHSIGTLHNNKKVGIIGAAAFFSFAATKPLNTFGGGMITTNHDKIAKSIRSALRDYPVPSMPALLKRICSTFFLRFLTCRLVFSFLLFPIIWIMTFLNIDILRAYNRTIRKGLAFKSRAVKYSNIQAHVGRRLLSRIDSWNEQQQRSAQLLTELLDDGIPVLGRDSADHSVHYFYVITSKKAAVIRRKLLLRGIDTGKQIMRDCALLFGTQDCPKTTSAYWDSVQIPLYPYLTTKDINYIATTINACYET